MTIRQFTLIIDGLDSLPDEMPDKLFEAGCDDCTPTSSGGVVRIHFDRQGDTIEAAVGSAMKQVAAAGYVVSKIEIEAATLTI